MSHPPQQEDLFASRSSRTDAREGAASSDGPRSWQGLALDEVLAGAFGHERFRPYQERVCRTVVAGRDALLVMPTGAGKSLCYQLPGLVRGGVTLVVSPLIALIEDQVAKLRDHGLRAERIHSARPREESRRVCRAYLDGALDYLFIAPERLSVPGFAEMLAKRPLALVAIDEAHCISQWGHDFRPDYRLLGGRLPALRPAPILALTATATPRVQRDIVEQLRLDEPECLIHGFRRDNLAIEVVELRPGARAALVHSLLAEPERRPAIVYAPTRKESEALAESLAATMPAAAYHAGLPPRVRDEAQERFLGGDLEVVVATIAFGMGVDKPDVRTVVHTGLPGTLEGYYQEIGRAGRDGLPARAVLLYSWADRRTHEFFHSRSYPDPEMLAAIYQQLGAPEPAEAVRQRLRMDEELFEAALAKLWVHGGAVVESGETVSRGRGDWRAPYLAQRQHRLDQLDEICRFAQTKGCRMLHLVRHFGDQEDSGERCGRCDACRPGEAVARSYRAPIDDELQAMTTILEQLRRRNGQGTGQLFRAVSEIHGSVDRGAFEELLAALARGGLLEVAADSFLKEGREIHFQRARLSSRGRRAGREELAALELADDRATETAPSRPRRGSGGRRSRAPHAGATAVPAESADEGLVEALRAWRLEEARRRKAPAFTIFPNRTLLALAAARPRDEDELLAVSGIGETLARRYGAALLEIVRESCS